MTKTERNKGASLVEIMVATVVLAIVILGTSSFRYYSTLQSRKANTRNTAARVALLLSESWRGLEGSTTYDPVASLSSELTISTGSGPAAPDDFTLLGNYEIELNEVNYYTTLSWKDVQAGLRALNIMISWAQRFQEEPELEISDMSFNMTTYAID